MDSPQPTQSTLETLRTVEFRLGLKGYNVDEVDEYLEKAAVEAEALHEQLRQMADRLRQASERIAQLEREVDELRFASDELRRRLTELTVERDEALETGREQLAEHTRLTARVRQLQARSELLRADATGARRGTDPRLRQLESEREQLATHIRAVAELLLAGERADRAGDVVDPGDAVGDGVADRLEAIRAQAVREANEHAERELRRLRSGTPL